MLVDLITAAEAPRQPPRAAPPSIVTVTSAPDSVTPRPPRPGCTRGDPDSE